MLVSCPQPGAGTGAGDHGRLLFCSGRAGGSPPLVATLPAGQGDHHTCRPQETHRTSRRPGAAAKGCWLTWAALATAQQAGDGAGQAGALNELGLLQRAAGDYQTATASHQQALELYCAMGDRLGQASALGNLGEVQRLTGDYPAAAASLTQALGIYSDIGYRGGQAEVLNDLGEVLSRSAHSHQVRDHHARALTIAREISAPLEEARALEGLGHCLLQDGNPGDTAAHWQQALTIYQRIGAPDAQRIQETLRQHGIAARREPPRC